MADTFQLIAITLPEAVADEATKITLMLDQGISRVHLRKPHLPKSYLRNLIQQIPARLHARLSLHDAHDLWYEFPDLHLHLNSRNPNPIDGVPYSVSCHSIAELQEYDEADYLFLSPVFDSISKLGYESAFSQEDLHTASRSGLIHKRIIALGGVTPSHIPLLRQLGFGGAAMLGYLWMNTDKINNIIRQCYNL